MRTPANEQLIRGSCALGLVALPLMVWSLFDRTVWPVMIALSVGQGVGCLAFLLFLVAVARDLRIADRLRRNGSKTE